MTDSFQIGPPILTDERNLYPIIRTRDFSCITSFWIDVTPIALIIEEKGNWSFVAIEEGITEDIISQITNEENK